MRPARGTVILRGMLRTSTLGVGPACSRRGHVRSLRRALACASVALAAATLVRAGHAQDAPGADVPGARGATDTVSIGPDERDERIVWSGEVQGKPARLAISPKNPTVPGIFVTWQGPFAGTPGAVAGSAVATQGDVRSAANFKIDLHLEPVAQLSLVTTGNWTIEVIPPVADAEKAFPKPITFVITAGETTVEGRPERRPLRAFFRRPEIRYTIMGVGFFVVAIVIIVQRYRG